MKKDKLNENGENIQLIWDPPKIIELKENLAFANCTNGSNASGHEYCTSGVGASSCSSGD